MGIGACSILFQVDAASQGIPFTRRNQLNLRSPTLETDHRTACRLSASETSND